MTFSNNTRYFQQYEEREEAFRERAFFLIPRKHLGPKCFWQDFRRISLDGFTAIHTSPMAFITSNPRDCLAFGSTLQVLTAACLTAEASGGMGRWTPGEVGEKFGMSANLHQPVRTLSGGETVKLAMAKSYAAAEGSTGLAIASPFSWLSRENMTYFAMLMEHYEQLHLPVEIFALEGEDSDRPADGRLLECLGDMETVDFTLRTENVRMDLGFSFNALYACRTSVHVDDFSAKLSSPCVIVGENGQGKSLVAKVLTGAISFRGRAAITGRSPGGSPRMLFQDVVSQTLLRPFDVLAKAAGTARKTEAMAMYKKIAALFRDFAQRVPETKPGAPDGDDAMARSLLGIKLILVAVRLSARPSALILDEPDWGMTRAHAIAFVTAVVQSAHAMGVPVLIISHKPWWHSVAASKVRVSRTETRTVGDRQSTFSIELHPDSGAAL